VTLTANYPDLTYNTAASITQSLTLLSAGANAGASGGTAADGVDFKLAVTAANTMQITINNSGTSVYNYPVGPWIVRATSPGTSTFGNNGGSPAVTPTRTSGTVNRTLTNLTVTGSLTLPTVTSAPCVATNASGE